MSARGCLSFLIVPAAVGLASLADYGIGTALHVAPALPAALLTPLAAGVLGYVTGGFVTAMFVMFVRGEPTGVWMRAITGAALVGCAPVLAAVGAYAACTLAPVDPLGIVGLAAGYAAVQVVAGGALTLFAPRATFDWLELLAGVVQALG